MTQKDMQKIFFSFFLILFSFKVFAADYDAFILNFLRVNPYDDTIKVEMALDIPESHLLQKSLEKGVVLKFSIKSTVSQERFITNKEISKHEKLYFISYEPLSRQFMVTDNDDINIRNTDIDYLFQTLIKNLHFSIPAELIKNKHYFIVFNVSIKETMPEKWVQKNLFFLTSNIIQPALFHYEFDF